MDLYRKITLCLYFALYVKELITEGVLFLQKKKWVHVARLKLLQQTHEKEKRKNIAKYLPNLISYLNQLPLYS